MSCKTQIIYNFTINLENQVQNNIPNNVIINIVKLKSGTYFINMIIRFFILYPDSCIQYIYDFMDIDTIDN
ncbi:hypothetical protein A0H76_2920 [Hepatospora eriocheir]|uniref:Uncharacterized protein n=1 Tax=Hepatospora eriocheir TaxID=1081669 RepID=A0A1X0Q5J2_9MICR|nr:hypothetical protein A0H76_2920 [Hepatospora eriocheir]